MTLLKSLLAASIGWLAASAVAQAQITCEAPKYSAQVAEASLTAQAEIRLAAIRQLSERAQSQLGDNSTGTVRVDGRYAVWAAAELAQGAYTDTVDSYFCLLRAGYANDAAKLAIVNREERRIKLQLDRFFDVSLWEAGADARAGRNAIRVELANATSGAALLPRAEVEAALKPFNFDTTRLGEINVTGAIGQLGTVGVCGGWVHRSIRRVDSSVLASLQNTRRTLIDWLTGDRAEAELDMWIFVSQQMGRQLTAVQGSNETIAFTPQYLTCLQNTQRVLEEQVNPTPAARSAPPAQLPPGT